MKITFLGGGNMANAMIGGLRKQGYSAAGIQVVEPVEALRENLTNAYGVRCTDHIDQASMNCEVWVLAIKPQQLREAIVPLRDGLFDLSVCHYVLEHVTALAGCCDELARVTKPGGTLYLSVPRAASSSEISRL